MPIAAFNRLTRTRLVSAGSAVAIGTLALTGVVTTGTAEAATPTTTTTTTTYTVQSGDTLTTIANTVHVPGGWQALASVNHLVNPHAIWPGQVLNLPSASPTGSTTTPTVAKTTAQPATVKTYPNNLDGWIRQSLAIMKQKGIPGSYNGIHRNIMRESSGNPYAVNNWDSNARAGIPSKGLLQVIQPTFNTYHVAGTAWSLFDPVANITAACNYAYHRYGSIDNVNGPY